MNFEQAMVGVQEGYEARRATWGDPSSFVRFVENRLMQFGGETGWKRWAASLNDEAPTDWLISHPARANVLRANH